jgi:hypothetical protein
MDDPVDRSEGTIANRIVAFFRLRLQLPRIGNELPRNRIVRVIWVDQLCDSWRNGNRIARRDVLKRCKLVAADQSSISEIGRRAHGFSLSSIHDGLVAIVHAPYA